MSAPADAAELEYEEHLCEANEELSEKALQKLLELHAPEAVRTLVELCQSAPPAVRRQAACDILNQRFGRPEQRQQPIERAKLVINVVRLSTGRSERLELAAPTIEQDVQEALRLAKTMQEDPE